MSRTSYVAHIEIWTNDRSLKEYFINFIKQNSLQKKIRNKNKYNENTLILLNTFTNRLGLITVI